MNDDDDFQTIGPKMEYVTVYIDMLNYKQFKNNGTHQSINQSVNQKICNLNQFSLSDELN